MEAPVDTAALVRKNDSIQKAMAAETKPRFIPNSNRAIWLALVIPGGGQIYNRKYWKLPIVYGGFVGCAYALTWNNRMYKDYSQAYLDIMDDDPDTKSYEDFLPHGMSAEGMEDTFKTKRFLSPKSGFKHILFYRCIYTVCHRRIRGCRTI